MTVPDEVLALIEAALPGVDVYDGDVPERPASRYVVYYPDNGTRRALAVCSVSDEVTYRFQTSCVAPDRQAAAWLSARICDELVDTRPTVSGWSCGQIGHTYSQRPQSDETVGERPVQYMVDLFELLTTRI